MLLILLKPAGSKRFQNRNLIILLAFMLPAIFSSCKKRIFEGTPGTVMFFNAMDDNVNLLVNMTGTQNIRYNAALNIYNKNSNNYKVYVVNTPQPLALYANYDTLPKDAPVINMNLNVPSGEIYSLFVFGSKTEPEYIMHKEVIPGYNLVDSATHIRFINLSPGQDITVNIKDQATGSLVQQLSYKQLSAFVPLKVDKTIASYTFEVRAKGSNELLATYIAAEINNFANGFNMWLHKPYTLVFAGKEGGAGSNTRNLYLMSNRF